MPSPLIIFENHLCSSSKTFITENVKELKQTGYSTVLIEMNSEISPKQVKSEITSLLNNPNITALQKKSFKAFLDLLYTLENHQISYAFIDPQTRTEALEHNKKLESLFIKDPSFDVIEAQEKTNFERDLLMSQTLIQKTHELNGGVIFICGFMHHHLIPLLRKHSRYDYKYVIFSHFQDNQAQSRESAINFNFEKWLTLSNQEERRAFYHQTEVHWFDYAFRPSFDSIQRICQLYHPQILNENPGIANDFNQTLGQEYQFEIDENYTLSASKEIINARDGLQQMLTLRRHFPKMPFFFREEQGKNFLTVPGINLPENRDELKNAFMKAGVMRKI